MPVTTVRQKVLAYFRKQPIASAAQIGRGLNLSAATVRHHLSILSADGRVEVSTENRRTGRGRPVKLYKLSEKTLGNNLASLSDAALSLWLSNLSASEQDEALKKLAGGLTAKIGRLESGVPAAKRLALVVEKLKTLHYQARWEAGAEGPRILFGHCPYAAIIKDHPELCRLDAVFLGELMGANARQLAKIEQGSNGSPYCLFRI